MDSNSDRKIVKREFNEEQENGTSAIVDIGILGGLCDDIVLGEVVPQFPWYKRPALMSLSRWWAHSMTNSFPYYARLQNPRTLSKSLVFFHTPSLQYPQYNAFCIWIHSDDEGTLRNIPVPVTPEVSRRSVEFLHDGNDERIYCFIALNDHYDVSVVDLRDGNIRWKKLPQLPFMEGHNVFSCRSFDNGGRFTTYHVVRIADNIYDRDHINYDVYSVCTLHARNDITELQIQWQPQLGISSDLIDKIIGYNSEEIPPSYLEISVPLGSNGRVQKCFYYLCKFNAYNTFYNDFMEAPKFLLMQPKDGKFSPEQQSSNSSNAVLYSMTTSDEAGIREVNIFKLKLDGENSRKVKQQSEWNAFLDTWNFVTHEQRLERTATKVSAENFLEWEKRRFNIDDVVDIAEIKVGLRSGLFVYALYSVL